MKITNEQDGIFSLEPEESQFGNGEHIHPDVLTADEILNQSEKKVRKNSALSSLMKKMSGSKEDTASTHTPREVDHIKEEKKVKGNTSPTTDFPNISEIIAQAEIIHKEKEEAKKEEENKTDTKKVPVKPSLLDKCMPYIMDEDGNDASVNKEPLYKLASVTEILKADGERTLEKLSREYGISFENITSVPENKEEKSEETPAPTQLFTETKEEESDFHFENLIKNETQSKPESEEETISSTATFQISDIDNSGSVFKEINPTTPQNTGTVTFTPITDISSSTKVVVSTHTKPIDLTGELLKVKESAAPETEEVKLEESEFDEFIPKEEFTDNKSGRELLKKFAKQKKITFLSVWGSILFTLMLAFLELPFMSSVILEHTKPCMIIASAFTLITIILNCRMFLSLINIFSRKADSDVLICLSTVTVGLYAVFGIIAGEIILHMLLFLSVSLCIRAICDFYKASEKLRSFKQIYNSATKRGIKLINDPAIAFAMSKGSVEGDTLIAAPQITSFTENYMKHSTFGTFLGGKINIIVVASIILSVLTGILAYSYFEGAVFGFYSAAVIQCFTAIPGIFFIDSLPLYHSSKKLAKVGGMIAGKTGAQMVEEANAVVLNSADLFPSGTVTLHRMQVLSENNLEDTIVRAASLTDALQSPLAPIFKKIAGTGNITVYPDSDTVKYEETLGISGWVDNRLLFIGNRTLMEAHGIEVPSVEVDRKILRQGYFPVYVASQNKACALLVVQYNADPNVSRELRRLSASGITILVKTSDPNLTEEMICDYLGLYEDSVKVMTAAGCHIYVNTVTPVKTSSVAAAYKSNPIALPTILNCAGRIKRSNILLTAAYVIIAVFGIMLFAYSSFGGAGSILSDKLVLLYGIISTAVTYLLYLIQKP